MSSFVTSGGAAWWRPSAVTIRCWPKTLYGNTSKVRYKAEKRIRFPTQFDAQNCQETAVVLFRRSFQYRTEKECNGAATFSNLPAAGVEIRGPISIRGSRTA